MVSSFGLLLKIMGSNVCLGTWTHDLYRYAYDGDSKYDQWVGEVEVTEEFQDSVMTYVCDGHYTGQDWERVPTDNSHTITIPTTTMTSTTTTTTTTTTTPMPEVGEQVKFRNVLQDKCLTASDGESGNLTFSSCDGNSPGLLWTRFVDGSYKSVAYPGRCPLMGDGARCRREYVELGECAQTAGFTMVSRTWEDIFNGKVTKVHTMDLLKMETGRCFGTWSHDIYKDAYKVVTRDDGWTTYKEKYRTHAGAAITEEFKNNVMTRRGSGCWQYPGQKWEKIQQ